MATEAKQGQGQTQDPGHSRSALDNDVSNQEKEQTITQGDHDFKEYACFLKNKPKPYRRQTVK